MENKWIVYNGEKGNKYNTNSFDNIIDACHELIIRLSETDETGQLMIDHFDKNSKVVKFDIT
ncbi:MAG: hypothetical protein HFH35_01975 [Eubacterium sp.]|nr:hypothetical protein [Eubacterium sp.]